MVPSYSKFYRFAIIFVIVNSLVSCGGDGEVSFKEQLSTYLHRDIPTDSFNAEKFNAYFDFTGAMIACEDAMTNATFNGLCQKITSNAEKIDIFKLGNDSIMLFSDRLKPAQIFSQIKNAKSKLENYAPIEKTLKKIIDEKCRALLITDFEEYTKSGQIHRQAYATPYFKKWMSMGGDITFFVTDYVEGKVHKHLYYVVFDFGNHELLNLVNDGLEGIESNYKKFILSNNAFPMSTNYPSAMKGGNYHDEVGEDVVSCVDEKSGDGYFKMDGTNAESYCFGSTWQDIIVNASFQTKDNGAVVPFTHLFRNLFIDLSKNSSYIIKSLNVRVTEIEDDFEQYLEHQTAMENAPVIKIEGGETYVEFINPEVGEKYYDAEGKLYDEFKSKYGIIGEIQDLLVFDNELFTSSFQKDPSKVELGIYFKKGASGKIVSDDADDANEYIYRIDIFVSDVDICDQETIDTLFYWTGNDCLSSSIKGTLQDMRPKNKILYSYFIRIL